MKLIKMIKYLGRGLIMNVMFFMRLMQPKNGVRLTLQEEKLKEELEGF